MNIIKFFILSSLFLFVSCKSLIKNDLSKNEIFKTILYDFSEENKEFYIECDKNETFFEINHFLAQTQLLDIPENVLLELSDNSKGSNIDKKWSEEILQEIKLGNDYLINQKCLEKEEINSLFRNSEKRQKVVGISKPIFDNKKTHCIVQISVMYFKGSVSGSTLFFKKRYGKWILIKEYDIWLS